MFSASASSRGPGAAESSQSQNKLDSLSTPSLEVATAHDPFDEIVNINVAGKRFQTYTSTLARFPDSLLGNRERRIKYKNDKTGEYFFDRHRPTFESILYYYQSEGVLARPPNIPLHIFIKELVFFDIGDDVIEQLQIDNGIKEPPVVYELPEFGPFKVMWNFLEYPDTSKPAKIFAILSVIVISVSLIMFVIETLPEFSTPTYVNVTGTNGTTSIQEGPNKHALWMFQVNTSIIIWFTLEFVLRLICCPSKLKFFVQAGNIIDLLSILPYYLAFIITKSGGGDQGSLAILRVIRVLRVFKLSRHSRGLQILGNTLKASFHELMMLGFFLFIMILIFGSCVYYAEYREVGTKFNSIPDSAWWAIVTMTTVGYGDLVPKTVYGKLIGGMAVVCGVLTIALPVPVVVSNFEYFYTKERNRRKTEEARKAQEKEQEKEHTEAKVSTFKQVFSRRCWSRGEKSRGSNSNNINTSPEEIEEQAAAGQGLEQEQELLDITGGSAPRFNQQELKV